MVHHLRNFPHAPFYSISIPLSTTSLKGSDTFWNIQGFWVSLLAPGSWQSSSHDTIRPL